MSFILLLLGALCTGVLVWRVPWYLSLMDFLIRPMLMGTLPLLVAGLILWRRSATRPPPDIVPILIISFGLVELLTLFVFDQWPVPNLQTTWEDSYQQLFVLEMLFTLLDSISIQIRQQRVK